VPACAAHIRTFIRSAPDFLERLARLGLGGDLHLPVRAGAAVGLEKTAILATIFFHYNYLCTIKLVVQR
jgi:hypothetical protein